MQKATKSRGRFIVIEGIDGAGTTTQVRRLVAELRSRNIDAVETREPTDGPVGMLLRQVLRGRLVSASGSAPSWQELGLLFAADRLDHAGSEIRPRVGEGTWLVSDRYDYSSVAYQSASAGNVAAVPWLRELNRHAPRPDLTVVIDVPPDVARARRLSRGGDQEIFDDDALQAHLADFYRDIEKHFPEDHIVHVTGDSDADSVLAAVLAIVIAVHASP